MYNYNKGRKKYLSEKQKNQMKKMAEFTRSKISQTIDLNQYPCPKCGKHMKWRDSMREGNQGTFVLFCDDCDMVGSARRETNGEIVLRSIPADKETRNLRKEAHYYFDILYKEHIFDSREQAYMWLTSQLLSFDRGIKHIGEMDKVQCLRAIEISKKCIETNKHRLSHPVEPFHFKRNK